MQKERRKIKMILLRMTDSASVNYILLGKNYINSHNAPKKNSKGKLSAYSRQIQ